MALDPDASLRVFHLGVPVLTMKHGYWGPKGWTWANPTFRLKKAANGQPVIVGNIPGLKLQVIGLPKWPSPDGSW